MAHFYGTTGPELAPPPGDHQFQAQTPAQQPAALGGFTYFTTFQAEIVNAAAGRIIPTDANGPGAIEAQLSADQQDRVLTDMQAGLPTTFDGSSIQAATTQPAGSGTEALQQMVPGAPGIGALAFFNLLIAHTIAGFFAVPVHGGNRDMVGWKLIGFPGAQMSYAGQISSYGMPFTGPYTSLAAYQGQFDTGA